MKLRSIFTMAMIICVPFFGIAQDPEETATESAATEIGGEVTDAGTSSNATDPGILPAAPIGVPIDGGLSLLLAAGVGYGIKKYRDQRRK